jgi:hypothetical protein
MREAWPLHSLATRCRPLALMLTPSTESTFSMGSKCVTWTAKGAVSLQQRVSRVEVWCSCGRERLRTHDCQQRCQKTGKTSTRHHGMLLRLQLASSPTSSHEGQRTMQTDSSQLQQNSQQGTAQEHRKGEKHTTLPQR